MIGKVGCKLTTLSRRTNLHFLQIAAMQHVTVREVQDKLGIDD